MEIGHLWNVRRQILLVLKIQVTGLAPAGQSNPPDTQCLQCAVTLLNAILHQLTRLKQFHLPRDGIG